MVNITTKFIHYFTQIAVNTHTLMRFLTNILHLALEINHNYSNNMDELRYLLKYKKLPTVTLTFRSERKSTLPT